MTRVLARDCAEYTDEAVGAIVDEALDTFLPGIEGKRVFVKPNLLSPVPPERGVTTHPVYVRTLLATLRKRGAREVLVGDNPGMTGYAAGERVAKKTGILEAAGDAFRNVSGEGVKIRPDGYEVVASRDIMEADIVINLPKLKTHALTVYTGAIKNMFGIIVGSGKVNAHRAFPHPDAFSRFMADVCAVRPPDLSILDAVLVMEGNGPNTGRLRKGGKILASSDPVALDAAALRMTGVPAGAVRMIGRARELGLGVDEGFELDGEVLPLPRFKLPSTMRLPKGFLGKVFNGIACAIVSRRIPKLRKKKCTGCQVCVKHCPQEALSMEEKLPRLDASKCISCFCCVELCTERAYKLGIKW
jgi:uncharacterized protein (DUF362 family)/Pyruvate/2-oxoacid:ferredoxin oxidoreductase delta subunit